jgi:hypothetical protein
MTTVRINGTDVALRICPVCQREVLVLITDFATGERFCHLCHEDPDSPMATVTRKINEHAAAETLDQYPLGERIADFNGEKFVKPN